MKIKKKNIIVICSIILYSIIFSIYAYYTLGHIMDSDIASEMLISRTLGEEHNFLMSKSIIYNTEIRFFDVQNLAGFFSCFISDWRLYTVLGNGFFLAFFCYTIYKVCYLVIKSENNEKEATVISLVCALLTCFPYSENYYYIGLGCGYYLGKYLLEALLLLFTLLVLKSPNILNWKYFVFLMLSALAGIKGIRYILVVFVPIFISLFVIFLLDVGYVQNIKIKTLKNKIGIQKIKSTFLIGTAMFAYIIGYVFNVKVLVKIFSYASYTGITFGEFGDISLAERAANLLYGWITVMGYIPRATVFSLDGITDIFIAVTLLCFAYCNIVLFKNFSKLDFLKKFIVLFVNASIVFNSYVFLVTDEFVARYYTPIYIFVFLIFAIYLTQKYESATYRVFVGIVVGIYILFSCMSAVKVINNEDKLTEREGTLNYLQENNYSFGYATFWNANVYAGLSNGQIEVAGIKNPSTMEPYRWNTLERYFQHDYCKEKTFILLDIDEYSEFKDSKVIQAGEGVYQDDRYIILEYPNSKMIYDLIGE